MKSIFLTCLIFFLFIDYGLSQEILEPINVSTQNNEHSSLTPFETEISKTPLSLSTFNQKKLNSHHITRLSDLSTIDASITDSYNSSGYWDIISIRGFSLDNKSSYLREGLPISGETSIPLENKERIEIIKGISNTQAGSSPPGGAINYIVKRPLETDLTMVKMEFSQRNSLLTALDLSRLRNKLSYRLNIAQENIKPLIRDSDGKRSLLAGAIKYRLSESAFFESEIEWSKRSQPSVPGFSLLGNKLPSPVNPNLNLNNQSWTKPVVFEGLTATTGIKKTIYQNWLLSLSGGVQNLITDDRLAYPFGCSQEGNYDRYCSDGTFDLYDYRSDNERRFNKTLKLNIEGQLNNHQINIGMWTQSSKDRMNKQAYNFIGIGNVSGSSSLPSNSTLTAEGSNRDSSNIDFFLFDKIQFDNWNLWLGARQSNFEKKSQQTNGSRKTHFKQSFLLPWTALSYDFSKVTSYLSYSEGIESFVTPNKIEYANKGQYLPGVKSRQLEMGVKGTGLLKWKLSLFQIKRPIVTDQPPHYEVDGEAKQRGLEADIEWSRDYWETGFSYMLLDAKREGSNLRSSYNGKKMINVPNQSFKSFIGYHIPQIKGMRADLHWQYEGERAILADNSIMLPAWSKWDMSLSYNKKNYALQLFIQNAFAKKYWKESPTQYGHVYLFPGIDRRISLNGQYSF